MKKRIAKKRVRVPWDFRGVEVGDLFHDCDGFNHEIARIERYIARYRRGWVVDDVILYREDGGTFCSCSEWALSEPRTPEEIVHYFTECWDEATLARNEGWSDMVADIRRMKSLWAQGIPICDERGLPSQALIKARQEAKS